MASVTHRADGSLNIRAYVRADPATGKAIYVSENLPLGSTSEAIDDAKQRVQARAAFLKGHIEQATVATAVECYLDSLDAIGRSPSTIASYRSLWKARIAPEIGSLPLDSARPSNFAGMYRRLRVQGNLAPSTVRKAHAFLSGCFTTLTADGVIETNPMAGIRAPGGSPPESQALDEASTRRLESWLVNELKTQEDWQPYMEAFAIFLCLHTGLRRGELAALRDEAIRAHALLVQLSAVRVSGKGIVYKPPKTKAGKRFVALGDSTYSALENYLNRRRKFICCSDPSQPLLCTKVGFAVTPDALTHAFKRISCGIGLPSWAHLHTLRHTHATLLLEQGANPREVQERLGHGSVSVTMGIYGHVLPGRGAELAATFEDVFKKFLKNF